MLYICWRHPQKALKKIVSITKKASLYPKSKICLPHENSTAMFMHMWINWGPWVFLVLPRPAIICTYMRMWQNNNIDIKKHSAGITIVLIASGVLPYFSKSY